VDAAGPTTLGSVDGTPVALFDLGGGGTPLVLIHGAAADHTTWRVGGPLLTATRRVLAMDRRGRGASGDGEGYSIEREFEDVVAIAERVAAERGGPIDILGHSFGGRVALGAALRTPAIGRLAIYESAPPPPGHAYQLDDLADRLRAMAAAGDGDTLLATFMTEVVGLSASDLAAYRADPVWPRRAAAAHTIPRELDAERSPAASLDALGAVEQPVLQVLGGASAPVFGAATRALDARLKDGRVVVIDGARHAAHHTHPEALVAAVDAFLEAG
jgi:pimeloyl-ACP methyl ester carboxylesterase